MLTSMCVCVCVAMHSQHACTHLGHTCPISRAGYTVLSTQRIMVMNMTTMMVAGRTTQGRVEASASTRRCTSSRAISRFGIENCQREREREGEREERKGGRDREERERDNMRERMCVSVARLCHSDTQAAQAQALLQSSALSLPLFPPMPLSLSLSLPPIPTHSGPLSLFLPHTFSAQTPWSHRVTVLVVFVRVVVMGLLIIRGVSRIFVMVLLHLLQFVVMLCGMFGLLCHDRNYHAFIIIK